MKIILADMKEELCLHWQRDFRGHPDVEIHHGSIFETNANTIVSPANSFGFMTGGVDYAISMYLGWHVQEWVKQEIIESFDGELLVGQAFWAPTEHEKFPFLICAPTMRVPSLIDGTINAYLATRASLKAAKDLQEFYADREIIPVFTGMGTGTGKMKPYVCSMQMLQAYEESLSGGPKFPTSLRDVSLQQRTMEI